MASASAESSCFGGYFKFMGIERTVAATTRDDRGGDGSESFY